MLKSLTRPLLPHSAFDHPNNHFQQAEHNMSVRQDRTNALALVSLTVFNIRLVEGIAYFRPNLDSIRFLGARCKLDRRLVLTRSQMRSALADGLFEIPQP